MMKMRIACALALLSTSTSFAGPWVDPQPGHGYLSLGYSNYQATQYLAGPCGGGCTGAQFDRPQKYGSKQPITINYQSTAMGAPGGLNSDYINNSLQFYGEVSLGKGIGFVAQMPLVDHVTQSADEGKFFAVTAPGDLVLGLKYQIPRIAALRGLAFGPQLYMTTPTGNVDARVPFPAAVRSFNENPVPIPTGNGTVDIEARLSAGYSFYPIPVFVIGEVGFHHHLDDATCTDVPLSTGAKNPDGSLKTETQRVKYSDDLPWTVQVGGTYAPKKKVSWFHHLTLIASVHGTHSFENNFIDKTNNPPFLRPCGQNNNATYTSAGGQLLIFFVKWFGLTYSIEHVLVGGNVGYGLTNMAGLAAQF